MHLPSQRNGNLLTRNDAIQDGRRRRSADSRRRIIQAMLELVLEGNPDPGAEAVAHRAGVGLRTVFRLFRDIESVVAEMLVPQREAFVDCFTAPFASDHGAPRVHELFARLSALYETRMPLRRAATTRRYSSASLGAGIRELDTAIDAFIRHALANTNPSEHCLAMLNLLLSYDAWMRLRDAQGLSQAQTHATLHTALVEMLT
jgi:AcrR family transcriptional regulator